jgi:hypothetical protein
VWLPKLWVSQVTPTRQIRGKIMIAGLTRCCRLVAVGAAVAAGVAGFSTAAGASSAQIESFRIVDRNGGIGTVQAHGVFDRTGTDVSRNSSDVLRFGNGKLVVAHPETSSTGDSFNLDPSTCRFTYTDTGTYTIKDGTGAYAGATGHGHYKATGSGVLQRNSDGTCNTDAQPKSEVDIVQAKGPLTLG